MKRLVVALAMGVAAPAGAEMSLVDAGDRLGALGVQVDVLRAELQRREGGPQFAGSMLDRLAMVEAELARLTAKQERLERQLRDVVSRAPADAAALLAEFTTDPAGPRGAVALRGLLDVLDPEAACLVWDMVVDRVDENAPAPDGCA